MTEAKNFEDLLSSCLTKVELELMDSQSLKVSILCPQPNSRKTLKAASGIFVCVTDVPNYL